MPDHAHAPPGCGGPFCVSPDGSKQDTNFSGAHGCATTDDNGDRYVYYGGPRINKGGYAQGCGSCGDLGSPAGAACIQAACQTKEPPTQQDVAGWQQPGPNQYRCEYFCNASFDSKYYDHAEPK